MYRPSIEPSRCQTSAALRRRDHTTVIHAVKQIERLRAQDSELDADIRLLTRQLEG